MGSCVGWIQHQETAGRLEGLGILMGVQEIEREIAQGGGVQRVPGQNLPVNVRGLAGVAIDAEVDVRQVFHGQQVVGVELVGAAELLASGAPVPVEGQQNP